MQVAERVQLRGEERPVRLVQPRGVDRRPEDLALAERLVREVLGALGHLVRAGPRSSPS